jgi:dienelactone hydrolase
MSIQTKELDYSHGGTAMRGFFAWDDVAAGRRPGVLVCHEWWGLNDNIRERARQFAQMGYAALALDIFGEGKTARDHTEASNLMTALRKNPDARGRVQAAVDVLSQQAQCDGKKLAAVGYCMGGSMALTMLRSGMSLLGVAALHAGLKADSAAGPNSISAKVLACCGADDPMIPPGDREHFAEEMTRAGADWQMILYGNTRHAFTNPNADKAGLDALKYSPSADRRSHEAVKNFLAEVFA